MMPGPALPDPKTGQGQSQLIFSMLTCAQQVDTKIFAYLKHIRPRHMLILDEQKQTVSTFPLYEGDENMCTGSVLSQLNTLKRKPSVEQHSPETLSRLLWHENARTDTLMGSPDALHDHPGTFSSEPDTLQQTPGVDRRAPDALLVPLWHENARTGIVMESPNAD